MTCEASAHMHSLKIFNHWKSFTGMYSPHLNLSPQLPSIGQIIINIVHWILKMKQHLIWSLSHSYAKVNHFKWINVLIQIFWQVHLASVWCAAMVAIPCTWWNGSSVNLCVQQDVGVCVLNNRNKCVMMHHYLLGSNSSSYSNKQEEWFKRESVCPTGCGCMCPQQWCTIIS